MCVALTNVYNEKSVAKENYCMQLDFTILNHIVMCNRNQSCTHRIRHIPLFFFVNSSFICLYLFHSTSIHVGYLQNFLYILPFPGLQLILPCILKQLCCQMLVFMLMQALYLVTIALTLLLRSSFTIFIHRFNLSTYTSTYTRISC